MEHSAEAAGTATALKPELPFTSIGVEVEEAFFLDEADGHGQAPPKTDQPSPFDLFADEDALEPSPAPAPQPMLLDAPRAASAKARATAAVVTKEPAPPSRLFSRRPSSKAGTVNLVALFVLVAAVTMVITIQACQVNRASRGVSYTQSSR